jgi:hypothetical protein
LATDPWPDDVMPVDISFRPTRVLIDGYDSEGKLILADGQLAALIVRLDGEHHAPEHRGWWHLEPRLGKCAVSPAPLFKTPEEAGDWVRQRLTGA